MNNPDFDAIYLSPHLDDAALSCGGQIYQQTQQGKRILIFTVAAGEPQTAVRSDFVQQLHRDWELSADQAVAARRAEDVRACQYLGADFLHWTLPDAIYRLHPKTEQPLYTSDEDIFGEVHPTESVLLETLAARMRELPATPRLVAPLGVGHHVDHQLTRQAAEQVYGDQLCYYEDYPYVQRDPQALEQLLVPAGTWKATLIPLSPEAVEARLEAILQYRSQIGTLFKGKALRELLNEHVRQVGGERLWNAAPDSLTSRDETRSK